MVLATAVVRTIEAAVVRVAEMRVERSCGWR
jgi:hypothetical protein